MKARHAILGVALAAAVTLTSVAAAGPDAAKQRVVITTQAGQTTDVSPFVLLTLTGSFEGDSGKMIGDSSSAGAAWCARGRTSRSTRPCDLEGKAGDTRAPLSIRVGRSRERIHVATATWKVVRGTGQYAGVTGGGRGATVWLERTDNWSSRMEGFLTLP